MSSTAASDLRAQLPRLWDRGVLLPAEAQEEIVRPFAGLSCGVVGFAPSPGAGYGWETMA